MKTTPFTHFHEALGARMAPFAGYNMPIEYPTGIKEEHLNVRNKLGVFDVSHMGEFWIKGPKAFELVQKLTTNDVAALIDGKVQYSCFPNDKGGIVDDLLVYRFSAEKYLLVVNAANIEKDWNWVVKYGAELGYETGRRTGKCFRQYLPAGYPGAFGIESHAEADLGKCCRYGVLYF